MTQSLASPGAQQQQRWQGEQQASLSARQRPGSVTAERDAGARTDGRPVSSDVLEERVVSHGQPPHVIQHDSAGSTPESCNNGARPKCRETRSARLRRRTEQCELRGRGWHESSRVPSARRRLHRAEQGNLAPHDAHCERRTASARQRTTSTTHAGTHRRQRPTRRPSVRQRRPSPQIPPACPAQSSRCGQFAAAATAASRCCTPAPTCSALQARVAQRAPHAFHSRPVPGLYSHTSAAASAPLASTPPNTSAVPLSVSAATEPTHGGGCEP